MLEIEAKYNLDPVLKIFVTIFKKYSFEDKIKNKLNFLILNLNLTLFTKKIFIKQNETQTIFGNIKKLRMTPEIP